MRHLFLLFSAKMSFMNKLDELRTRIDEMDDGILDAMAFRSRYMQNKRFYEETPPDKLVRHGYNAEMTPSVLLPIIYSVCEPGDDEREWPMIRGPDIALQRLVYGRIVIGRDVAAAKLALGLATEDQTREECVLTRAYARACELGLDPDGVDSSFRLIMENNKLVQRYPGAAAVLGTTSQSCPSTSA